MLLALVAVRPAEEVVVVVMGETGRGDGLRGLGSGLFVFFVDDAGQVRAAQAVWQVEGRSTRSSSRRGQRCRNIHERRRLLDVDADC